LVLKAISQPSKRGLSVLPPLPVFPAKRFVDSTKVEVSRKESDGVPMIVCFL